MLSTEVDVTPVRFPILRCHYRHYFLILALTLASYPCSAQRAGEWTDVIPLPIIPVAAALLPNGRVLGWSANAMFTFEGDIGDTPSQTYTSLTTPQNLTSTLKIVTNTGADMFCPGTAYLSNGQLLVNGGDSSPKTSIYDPPTSTWFSDAEMSVPRGYNADVLLSTGSVLTLGGSWSGDAQDDKIGEVWTQGQGWSPRSGISAQPITGPDPQDIALGYVYRGDNHAWLFAVTEGRVFHAGPSAEMHWITTDGDGTIVTAGNRGNDPYSMNGKAVMYDIGKIFKTGGAPAYQDASATTNTYIIDISDAIADPQKPVVVTNTAPMQYPRAFANAVVLPTGQILVVGGQTYALPFSDDTAVLTPELWDPASMSFTPLAPMQTPRVYHSVALLLPDGRIFVGGGGQCGACATNHPDAEIFSPPYLFNSDGTPATRPAITSAPSAGTLGQTIEVTTSVAVENFAIMRLSASTHAVDNDQRRVPLTIQSSPNAGYYVLSIPADAGSVPLGYYMLFAMDAQGVPSQARMMLMN
jgi:galactose oxidase